MLTVFFRHRIAAIGQKQGPREIKDSRGPEKMRSTRDNSNIDVLAKIQPRRSDALPRKLPVTLQVLHPVTSVDKRTTAIQVDIFIQNILRLICLFGGFEERTNQQTFTAVFLGHNTLRWQNKVSNRYRPTAWRVDAPRCHLSKIGQHENTKKPTRNAKAYSVPKLKHCNFNRIDFRVWGKKPLGGRFVLPRDQKWGKSRSPYFRLRVGPEPLRTQKARRENSGLFMNG